MHWSRIDGSLDFVTLNRLYASGDAAPEEVVQGVFERIDIRGDDHVWIDLIPREQVREQTREVEAQWNACGRDRSIMPLYGLPFAVKDNMDVAGRPTTVACPEFSYTPETTARAVEKVCQAGAILIGKTNLDQFASGLVGVRKKANP